MRNAIVFSSAAVSISVALLIAQAPQPGTSPRPAPKGGVEGRLTWFDRQGKATAIGEPGLYRTLTVSPDGKQVAFERNDASQNRDIWIIDSAGGAARRFTSDPGWDAFPLWSPDGKRIIFTSNRSGNYELYVKNVTGGGGDEELFYKSSDGKGPTSWSPDGRFLVYYSLGQPTHVKLLAASGPADRQAMPVVDLQFNSVSARFSPDGRWIAYSSNESGASEISVRPFDPASGVIGKPTVVTHDGGRAPLWRADGKEMFYIAQDGTAVAIDIDASTGFKAGAPKRLFSVPAAVLFWDAAPDGSGFVMPVASR